MSFNLPLNIGVVGTDFIASGLARVLAKQSGFDLTSILATKHESELSDGSFQELKTSNAEKFFNSVDVVFESSGDPLYAAEIVAAAFERRLPVITMDSEFHVTVGSYFASRGFLSEAHGDQPGALAELHEDALAMGFRPLVFGNRKGFLNLNPERSEMIKWSRKLGIREDTVVAATDGTKVQMEQALICNGLGAGIAKDGLLQLKDASFRSMAVSLGDTAKSKGYPISDFVIVPDPECAVFIVAEHGDEEAEALRYYKLEKDPYYILKREYHLCHLEIPKTLNRLVTTGEPLLNNSQSPHIGVAAVAKRDLGVGHEFSIAIGGYDLRGEAICIDDHPEHIPIGLLKGARIKTSIETGQMIKAEDVDIPDSIALRAWHEILECKKGGTRKDDGYLIGH